MISKDDIILFNRAMGVSENKKGYVLKSKSGKTYVSSNSLNELFRKAKLEHEFEYLLMNYKKLKEQDLKYILNFVDKNFKIYLIKDNEIIEYKI